jgi:hypothetical protein
MAVYNNFKSQVMKGNVDLTGDTIACVLLDAAYSPDIDADTAYGDITGNEEGGTGYTAGGQALSNLAVTTDTTDDEGVFDADDVTWSGSSITAQYAAVYKSGGANPLIAYVDFGSEKKSSSGDFTVQWDAEGIVNLT